MSYLLLVDCNFPPELHDHWTGLEALALVLQYLALARTKLAGKICAV